MVKINRNSACPCGSGKKYKHCCLGRENPAPSAEVLPDNLDWGKDSRGRDQDKEIDRFIIQGYGLHDKQEYTGSCEAWSRVWDQLLLRLTLKMKTTEQSLDAYDGSFFLTNWLQDYCADLHNAALKEASFAAAGVTFCSQVLFQFPDEKELFQENFRASLAEFHFLAGEPDEGEKVLAALINDRPHRSVGYAYLADMLGDAKYNLGGDQPLDLDRAIALLEQGLAYPVEDAEDYDLERRLGWFREAQAGP